MIDDECTASKQSPVHTECGAEWCGCMHGNSPQHSAAARKTECCCGVLRIRADPRVVVKVKLRTHYPCSRAVSTGREHGRRGHGP